jgi:hypothetical protein
VVVDFAFDFCIGFSELALDYKEKLHRLRDGYDGKDYEGYIITLLFCVDFCIAFILRINFLD